MISKLIGRWRGVYPEIPPHLVKYQEGFATGIEAVITETIAPLEARVAAIEQRLGILESKMSFISVTKPSTSTTTNPPVFELPDGTVKTKNPEAAPTPIFTLPDGTTKIK